MAVSDGIVTGVKYATTGAACLVFVAEVRTFIITFRRTNSDFTEFYFFLT